MKFFLLIGVCFYLVSCTTIVKRDLPIVYPKVSKENKPSLLVSSPRTPFIFDAELLRLYFKNLGVFREVDVAGDYEYISPDKSSRYDLHIELDFISSGYFHPYCILTLAILPCTPPLNWTLGAVVSKPGIQGNKTYLVKEDAMQITWAFGPLFSGFGRRDDKIRDLKENMLNNIMVKMQEDKGSL